MKNNVYKFIPTLAIIITGLLACWKAPNYSSLFNLLYSTEFCLPGITIIKLIFLVLIFPAIALSLLGKFGVEKLIKGRKLLFIIWLVLFFVWLFWLLILIRPMIFDSF